MRQQTSKEVTHYTKSADQKIRTRLAMERLIDSIEHEKTPQFQPFSGGGAKFDHQDIDITRKIKRLAARRG